MIDLYQKLQEELDIACLEDMQKKSRQTYHFFPPSSHSVFYVFRAQQRLTQALASFNASCQFPRICPGAVDTQRAGYRADKSR